MLATENVLYVCRWFMRNNLCTTLWKRIHERILNSYPSWSSAVQNKAYSALQAHRQHNSWRINLLGHTEDTNSMSLLKVLQIPHCSLRFCPTHRSTKASHHMGHGGVDLCEKIFWACSSTKIYRLRTVKWTCICPYERAWDLPSPREARLIC